MTTQTPNTIDETLPTFQKLAKLSPQTPKLGFPEFSDKWEVKKFGEIFTFRTTNSFSRDNLNYEFGSVRNIHYGDIHTKFKTQFNLKNELVPFVNEEINIDKIPADNYCKVGDLVIADASEDYADIGKSIEIINLNNEKAIAGLHTFLARPDLLEMSLGFNGYIMQSRNIRLQIMTIAQGTKVLSISTGRLANVELTIPQLPEQAKIANFLTAIDEKIQALKQKKTLLEQYKKGVMQQIFSQEIRFAMVENRDLPTFEKLANLCNGNAKSDRTPFPDWEEKSLGEIGTFYSGGTPLTTKREFFSGEIPFIRSGEINSDKTEQFITELGLKNSSAKKVEIGDILYAMYGATSGEVAISKISGAINQAILCIRTTELNHFIYYYLQLEKEKILKTYLQGGQGNLSAEIIKSLSIPVPSLPEQQKIANFLSAIDEKIEKVSQQITATETYKKGLLQAMFV